MNMDSTDVVSNRQSSRKAFLRRAGLGAVSLSISGSMRAYGLDVHYQGADDSDYAGWLGG